MVLFAGNANAQCEIARLSASDGSADDHFDGAVALGGDYDVNNDVFAVLANCGPCA